MSTLKFKTNINCTGCIDKVTPFLNSEKGLESWAVDTSTPDKILSVDSTEVPPEKIIKLVKDAGFRIEEISEKPN